MNRRTEKILYDHENFDPFVQITPTIIASS